MNESNFYEFINIHYGVKSAIDENLNEKINKRKKEIIQYKIDIENAYIGNISKAKDEL